MVGNMETYKIEKGIPIESKQGKIKFTAECMRIGDSVLMESYPRAVSLANALRNLKKIPTLKFNRMARSGSGSRSGKSNGLNQIKQRGKLRLPFFMGYVI